MIKRDAESTLKSLATQFKVVAVVGPRQSGKTTLARHLFKKKPYVSLENPDKQRFALDDPRGFLAEYKSGALLDEVQRTPEIFSYLQQIVDERNAPGQFILTGSNNFLLQENISQSLAGRVAYLYLLPFAFSEIGNIAPHDIDHVLFSGGYPPVWDHPVETSLWYANYIRTYLERDVRLIKNITDLHAFDRFMRLCAGRVGQLLNMSNLAIETGVDVKTIGSWLGVLESSFIVHRLQPHHKNFNKRVVKMPKLYFYDTGLACALLGLEEPEQLSFHHLKGSLFENFVIGELLKQQYNRAKSSNLWFWRDNTGHEIDVVIERPQQLFPVEIKSGKTITSEFFKGLRFWQKISGDPGGAVVYAGDEAQKRSNRVEIYPWSRVAEVAG